MLKNATRGSESVFGEYVVLICLVQTHDESWRKKKKKHQTNPSSTVTIGIFMDLLSYLPTFELKFKPDWVPEWCL